LAYKHSTSRPFLIIRHSLLFFKPRFEHG
jgi:hypothetical protein